MKLLLVFQYWVWGFSFPNSYVFFGFSIVDFICGLSLFFHFLI